VSLIPLISEDLRAGNDAAMSTTPSDTEILVERAGRGDPAAVQELLLLSQSRLTRTVAVRLDRRVDARVDPADIVQEALLDVARNSGPRGGADALGFVERCLVPWPGPITAGEPASCPR
jgi:hypothetical protein